MNLLRKLDSIREHSDLRAYVEKPIDFWVSEYTKEFSKEIENF